MKKFTDTLLKAVANNAMNSAKKEADSACIFIGYQPQIPAKLHELKDKK